MNRTKIRNAVFTTTTKDKGKRDEILCISDGTVRSVGNKLLVLVEGTLDGRIAGKSVTAGRRFGERMLYLLDLGFPRFPFLSSTFELLIRHTHVDRVLDRIDVDNLNIENAS